MGYARHISATLTTDGDGNATYTSEQLSGRIVSIIYTKDNYDNGVDFIVGGTLTGLTYWNEANVNSSKQVNPMQQAHSFAGIALTFDSSEPLSIVPFYVANEQIVIQVSAGGAGKSGHFFIILE